MTGIEREENYRRALQRLRFIAGLHYMGGAFEPEHMRDLANIAADALADTEIPPMPDPEAVKTKVRKWAEEYSAFVSDEGICPAPDTGHHLEGENRG